VQSKFLSAFKYLVLLAIAILLLWLTFRHENLLEIFDKIKHANFWFVSLSVILGFIAFVIRAYRWNMLLEPLGYNAKLINACSALALGYFANLAIPRIGEITRCGVLSKSENVPFEKLIGTVIIERVIDLIMLLFSMLLVAFLEYDLLMNFIMDKIIIPMKNKTAENSSAGSSWILILIIVVLFAFAIIILKSKKLNPIRNKILNLINGIMEGLKTIFKIKRPGVFVFHTFFIWFLYFLATYVCFFAFSSTSQLGMKEGVFLLVAGGLGMSAPVQGGIGAYHYIVSQSLMLFNVSSADGIAFATLAHIGQTLLVILLGCISLFLIFIANNKPPENAKRTY
jgi:uncharacterized protein (TIRG00374 family)